MTFDSTITKYGKRVHAGGASLFWLNNAANFALFNVRSKKTTQK
jgi:hypothetical protein